ncbi:hypothetical protein SCP_1702660 [Sparassis crispa]|uniref:Uncharacterized protein n=1 Tax=Sparassis crispa TaxID=139825 RepID=A0A401H6G2_9APHY|nr:hypothetical protein SCP_1702660 [Sparassis crispa]GBE89940.1 hypothetical protein SCP_1702660 [Sparassis crispa]
MPPPPRHMPPGPPPRSGAPGSLTGPTSGPPAGYILRPPVGPAPAPVKSHMQRAYEHLDNDESESEPSTTDDDNEPTNAEVQRLNKQHQRNRGPMNLPRQGVSRSDDKGKIVPWPSDTDNDVSLAPHNWPDTFPYRSTRSHERRPSGTTLYPSDRPHLVDAARWTLDRVPWHDEPAHVMAMSQQLWSDISADGSTSQPDDQPHQLIDIRQVGGVVCTEPEPGSLGC